MLSAEFFSTIFINPDLNTFLSREHHIIHVQYTFWGTLYDSIRSTRSRDPWNNDTRTFLVLKTWQQTLVDLYEALRDSTRFARSRVSRKSTYGMSNRQKGKRFGLIRSKRLESTTFSTHPQSPYQLYFSSLAQIDFRHVESAEGETIWCRFDGIGFTNRFPVSRIANTKLFARTRRMKAPLHPSSFDLLFVFQNWIWKENSNWKTIVD